MRIVQISPRHYSSIGGVEHVVKHLSYGMKKRGHEVAVVCGSSSAKHSEIREENGIEVLVVPTYAPSNSFHIPKNRKAVETFIEKNTDVVHTHSAHAVISMLPCLLKNSLKPKWKLVYTLHFSTQGYTPFRRFLWSVYWKRNINSKLKIVDAIHATSTLESNIIMKEFSNAIGKVNLVPLGLDEDVFHFGWKGLESDYFLYSGRIEKYKRLDVVVKAMELVRSLGHPVKLIIAGDGSYSDSFRKMSEKKDWVIYMQSLPRQEYLELISKAKGVINLSSAENFSLFLAEAAAMGVPIVATSGAAAFCQEFANITNLSPNYVASIIAKAIEDPCSCIFPKTCEVKPWENAIIHFENFYRNIIFNEKRN